MEKSPESTIIKRTLEWESYLLKLGWIAPINLEQVHKELIEAIEATNPIDEEKEIGDILQVVIRYCARKRYDPVKALCMSLDRNITRTELCIEIGGIPTDSEQMGLLWKETKELLKASEITNEGNHSRTEDV